MLLQYTLHTLFKKHLIQCPLFTPCFVSALHLTNLSFSPFLSSVSCPLCFPSLSLSLSTLSSPSPLVSSPLLPSSSATVQPVLILSAARSNRSLERAQGGKASAELQPAEISAAPPRPCKFVGCCRRHLSGNQPRILSSVRIGIKSGVKDWRSLRRWGAET